MSYSVYTLAVPVSVTAGAATGCLNMKTPKVLQCYGTFVATVQIQGSNDGETWVSEGAAFTAPGAIEITKPWAFLRANTTAFTSGAPLVKFTG